MTIWMEPEDGIPLDFDYKEVIEQVVRQAVFQEGCPYECELNLTFTDNEGIREINREFRELDVPTDVLSFPMVTYPVPGDFSHLGNPEQGAAVGVFNPETQELLLGDIVISLERAKEQSEQYGHSMKREIAFLVAHSMLHLFGYDHMESGQREVMEEKQEKILQDLGIVRKK